MLNVETSKGSFVVVEYENYFYYPFHMYIHRFGADYIQLVEITEDEACKIVDSHKNCKRYYLVKTDPQKYYNTAKESLIYELQKLGVKITQNTYIFKL